MTDEAYTVHTSPDGKRLAVIIPVADAEHLWRAFFTLLESHKGIPLARSDRGELLRKLGRALRGAE